MNNNILTIIINAVKSRVMPLMSKLAMLRSPSYLRTKVFSKIRQFFIRLLDVKPKDKKDYYTVGNWMISKRLAFAVVIILGTVSILYLIMVRSAFGLLGSSDGIRTYKYTSMILRMQKGTVRIKAKDGHIAYEGAVADGYATGQGSLYNKAGDLIYQGDFVESKYEGSGVLYYPSGKVEYNGKFSNNLYNGEGKLFRENGNKEYEGEFADGLKEGEGEYFNAVGDLVYAGTFSADEILYSKLAGMPVTELAKAYTGRRIVYQNSGDMVVELSDINALYEIPSNTENLNNSAQINEIYVMSDHFRAGGTLCTSIRQLNTVFGSPVYQGESAATLGEAVAINKLSERKNVYSGPVEMEMTATLNDYVTIDSYSTDYLVYLYAYESDGLIYTFLTRDETGSSFDLYFITKNEMAEEEEEEAS